MLKTRLLTAAVLLPLLLAAMFMLPNSWWSLALVAPLSVAGHEWAQLAALGRRAEAAFLAVLLAACAALWVVAIPGADSPHAWGTLAERAVYALSAAFWCVIAPCWLWLKLVVRHRVVLAIAGLVVLLPTWLALARLQHDAKLLLLLLLGVVWIADTAAYFSGRALGRHKLAPTISPGKTWEGVGGAFAAVTVYALTLYFSQFFARYPQFNAQFIIVAFLGITTIGIVGDLFESWLKRSAGVKDSGTLLPGHGGVLDRIDAITAALPLAALIFI